MTEYDTLFAARRLLATVEAGRAASLSLAAAYLPLRSAAYFFCCKHAVVPAAR